VRLPALVAADRGQGAGDARGGARRRRRSRPPSGGGVQRHRAGGRRQPVRREDLHRPGRDGQPARVPVRAGVKRRPRGERGGDAEPRVGVGQPLTRLAGPQQAAAQVKAGPGQGGGAGRGVGRGRAPAHPDHLAQQPDRVRGIPGSLYRERHADQDIDPLDLVGGRVTLGQRGVVPGRLGQQLHGLQCLLIARVAGQGGGEARAMAGGLAGLGVQFAAYRKRHAGMAGRLLVIPGKGRTDRLPEVELIPPL